MEDKNRPFEAVQVTKPHVENGSERFTRDGYINQPAVASWRVNLTALSQYHNLYFVAVGRHIQVYRPDFPSQVLGNQPLLTINTHHANDDAYGYITPSYPHYINHLIVGDLGNQEILLVSTDSGNVAAYYITSVLSAIGQDPHRYTREGLSDFVRIRPFFSEWVYESAWGLAIHSEARVIAVSCNVPHHFLDTHDYSAKIHVFAFALHQTGLRCAGDGISTSRDAQVHPGLLDWAAWSPDTTVGGNSTPKRDRNYKIVLAGNHGHSHNIPSVAFANNGEDRQGSWLLSTDIRGGVKMWQIWTGRCFDVTASPDGRSAEPVGTQTDGTGWLTAFLATNSFRPAESNLTFFGDRRVTRYVRPPGLAEGYDVTHVVRHLPSNFVYRGGGLRVEGDDDEPEPDVLYEDVSDSEVTPDEDEARRVQALYEESANSSVRLLQFMNVDETLHADNDSASEISDEGARAEAEHEGEAEILLMSDFSDDEASNTENPDSSPTSVGSLTSTSSYNPRYSQEVDTSAIGELSMNTATPSSTPKRVHSRGGEIPIVVPDMPFIHCSESHLRMFANAKSRSPHILCKGVLREVMARQLHGHQFGIHDRLCMIAQIPDLGIVIIGSLSGRCIVCTLTKRTSDDLFGLRFDCILPTKLDELAQIRPRHMLLGIAAGPIQGHFREMSKPISDDDTEERWAIDREIDGIHTTFDSSVVDMDHTNEHDSTDESMYGSDDFESDRDADTSAHWSPEPSTSPVATRRHRWSKPSQSESWRATESSKRYRLMMTYADMTVLTYEISRGVDKEDIRIHSV